MTENVVNTLLVVTLIVFIGWITLWPRTDSVRTTKTLNDMGFTRVSTGGYAWFSCGDDYMYHTKFTATNLMDRRVSGVVCCGWFKGCTVKF